MNPQSDRPTIVMVVDPCLSEYVTFAPWVHAGEMDFRFLVTGGAALRLAPDVEAALWIINVDLPDMGGFDLFEMLRADLAGASVVMVGNQYRQEDEIASTRAGATLYVCKPLDISWFSTWNLSAKSTGSQEASVPAFRFDERGRRVVRESVGPRGVREQVHEDENANG